jgi:hypothetical protein
VAAHTVGSALCSTVEIGMPEFDLSEGQSTQRLLMTVDALA